MPTYEGILSAIRRSDAPAPDEAVAHVVVVALAGQ